MEEKRVPKENPLPPEERCHWNPYIPRCGSKKRNSEERCSQPAGAGTPHFGVGNCKWHGGNSPTHVKSGVRTLLNKEIESDLLQYAGIGTEGIHPEEGLQHSLDVAENMVLASQMRILRLLSEDETNEKHLEVARDQLGKATDRLSKISKMAIDAGFGERLVKIAEDKGQIMGKVIGMLIERANLNDETRNEILRVVQSEGHRLIEIASNDVK